MIEETKQKASSKGYSVQPYIIIKGPDLAHINNVYIVIDVIRFKFQQLLFALDICFKSFHTLNAKYPPQAEHIWTTIQKCAYKISKKDDKTYPYLAHVFKHFMNS